MKLFVTCCLLIFSCTCLFAETPDVITQVKDIAITCPKNTNGVNVCTREELNEVGLVVKWGFAYDKKLDITSMLYTEDGCGIGIVYDDTVKKAIGFISQDNEIVTAVFISEQEIADYIAKFFKHLKIAPREVI